MWWWVLVACSGDPDVVPTIPPDTRPRRVLVLGADGVRPDALDVASTPALDRLAAPDGLRVDDAITQQQVPPYSGPGWGSLLTGQPPMTHGVLNNDMVTLRDPDVPTFVEVAFEAGLETAVVAHWTGVPLIIGLENTSSLVTGDDAEVGAEVLRRVQEEDDDLIMVHFDDPDHAGHATGFSPDNPDYVAAIAGVDAHVAPILDAVLADAASRWRVLFVTDHGGLGTGHGEMVPEVRTIPMRFWGEGIADRGEGWRQEDIFDVVMSWLALTENDPGT